MPRITPSDQQLEIVSDQFGTDLLSHIEKLRFEDFGCANDIDANAGIAAKAIITSFGVDSLITYMDKTLSLTDMGYGLGDRSDLVANLDLIESIVGDASHRGFVDYVFENVVGQAPTVDEAGVFTALLENNETTRSGLLEAVAQTESTESLMQGAVIDLLGIPFSVEFI